MEAIFRSFSVVIMPAKRLVINHFTLQHMKKKEKRNFLKKKTPKNLVTIMKFHIFANIKKISTAVIII